MDFRGLSQFSNYFSPFLASSGPALLPACGSGTRGSRGHRLPPSKAVCVESVLIVGVNRIAVILLRVIEELGFGGMRVAGLIALERGASGRRLFGHHVFGAGRPIEATVPTLALRGVTVQRIIVTVSPAEIPRRLRDEIIATAKTLSIRVDNLAQITRSLCPTAPLTVANPTLRSEPLQGLQLDRDEVERILMRPYWTAKRLLDAVVAAVLLVRAFSLFGRPCTGSTLYTRIARDLLASPNGVLWPPLPFAQVPNHERHLRRRRPAGRGWRTAGELWPISCKFTRLDELPQLWNILVGEMSFVGPRPLLPVDQMPCATARCLARPGLTGWAQVMGGRTIGIPDKMALDIFYVRHASLRLDLEILARTLPVIFFGEMHLAPKSFACLAGAHSLNGRIGLCGRVPANHGKQQTVSAWEASSAKLEKASATS